MCARKPTISILEKIRTVIGESAHRTLEPDLRAENQEKKRVWEKLCRH